MRYGLRSRNVALLKWPAGRKTRSKYLPPALLAEKAMAPHSSTLAWKIPWTEEPGRLQTMGSLRVGHDWATSLSLFTFMHWRRKWQPTPVFLAWRIPGTGEPGGLPSMGSHRVGHDWSDLAVAAAALLDPPISCWDSHWPNPDGNQRAWKPIQGSSKSLYQHRAGWRASPIYIYHEHRNRIDNEENCKQYRG